MRLAIMQPYFLPYLGYFQLIAAVDVFVVYDNIKYTKKGWINRNRMLRDGTDATFTLPLKNASDALDVRERELAPDFNRAKLLNSFSAAYRRAPFFEATWQIVETIVCHEDANLFRYLHHSIIQICRHLGITTPVVVSSTVPIDHSLRGAEKVLAICRALGADTYINPLGGTSLYTREQFAEHGITLHFLESKPIPYEQFGGGFVPWLSIVDVMMFNDPAAITRMLHGGHSLAPSSP
jgi:hypothetical protein